MRLPPIFALLGLMLSLPALWLHRDTITETKTATEARGTSENLLEQVAERTQRESKFGTDPVSVQAPAEIPLTPEPQTAASALTLPPGYQLATHVGMMPSAPLEEKAGAPTPPIPNWLDPASGIASITTHPRALAGEPVFAAVRVAADTSFANMRAEIERHGARVEGASGDHLRILVPADAQIETIANTPGILGLGVLPPELKLDRQFADSMMSAPASDATPVFITLMGEDRDGRLKRALTDFGVVVGDYDADLRSYTANLPASAVEQVAAQDYVMHIEPVPIASTLLGSAVPVIGGDSFRQYDYALESFVGLTGRGIAIGMVDTGLNVRHRDIGLGRASVCGANFVQNEEWDLWSDRGNHGTHVFGIMAGAGRADPGNAGMAPNLSHLRFAKVLAAGGGGNFDDIRRGMTYLSEPSRCPAQDGDGAAVRPMIVNASLGYGTLTQRGRGVAERKVDSIVHTGQIYVVAQGNSGEFAFSNLSTAKNALSVGALFDDGTIAPFSSYGPTGDGRLIPKVMAPGVAIESPLGGGVRDGYAEFSGTSQASPAVAGLAALLLEVDQSLRNQPALMRARLMAGAIRPDPYLESAEVFPRNNSNGPGTIQHQYGMGPASARTSFASLQQANGWHIGSALAVSTNGNYNHTTIDVPEGTKRLDLVMTWDEAPADTLTSSVFNDLDLYLDLGADCSAGVCGQHVSRSRVDNVEWIIISDPAPGTHQIRIVPERLYGEPVKAALAWKIIRGESTPKLNLEIEELPQSGGGESVTLRFSVHTSGYLASGTTLHFGCTDTGEQDCEALAKALEETTAHVVRKDGLTREVTVQLEAPQRFTPINPPPIIGPTISLGEVAPGAPRQLEVQLDKSKLPSGTGLHVTASAWNAVSANRTLFVDNPMPAPKNDAFEQRMPIGASEAGETQIVLSSASREPGEPRARGRTRSLWYEWQVAETGVYRISLAETDSGRPSEVLFDIYSGDKIAALTQIESKQGSEITFTAHRGSNYQVRLSTESGINPALTMRWTAADTPPANDNLADAIMLSGSEGSIAGNNRGATLEENEFWGGLASSTWYSWTAPADGEWVFEVPPLDSAQMPDIGLPPAFALPPDIELPPGLGNAEAGVAIMVFAGRSFDDLRLLSEPEPDNASRFRAVQGEHYHIAVVSEDAGASTLEFELRWNQAAVSEDNIFVIAHDHFDQALSLEGAEGSASSTYVPNLTAQTHEPYQTGIGSLWWRWTAPSTGRFTFLLKDQALQASIFEGQAIDTLTLVALGAGGVPLVLEAKGGRTYHIAIGRPPDAINTPYPTLFGFRPPFEFQWGATPGNDNREHASIVTGSNGQAQFSITFATVETGEALLDTVARESLWWRWSAPTSGWHAFSVMGNPAWAIISVYRANRDWTGIPELITSSEHNYLGSGRVEAAFRARASEQYLVRVAKRPNQHGPLQFDSRTLSWRTIPEPAYLAYIGTNGDMAGADSPIQSLASLAINDQGNLLFAAAASGLLVFDRDVTSGALQLATHISAESNDASATSMLDPFAIAGSTLWWSKRHGRLFALHTEQSNAFIPPSESTPEWTRTEISVENNRSPRSLGLSALAATSDDRFVYVSQSAGDENAKIDVYSVDSASSIRRVHSLVATTPEDDTEVRVDALGMVRQMVVSPDDSHLLAATELALLVFSIDPQNGRLELIHHIPVESTPGSPFETFFQLSGVALNSTAERLFVAGDIAPQVAVFDVSEGFASPRHLDTLTDFGDGNATGVLSHLAAPRGIDFVPCWQMFAQRDIDAVDVLCEAGQFVALWDKDEQKLRVEDWSMSGRPNRFGQTSPETAFFGLARRGHQAATSPGGEHLYIASSSRNCETNCIHMFERTRTIDIDASGNLAPSINKRLKNQTAFVGRPFMYQVPEDTFTDPDQDALTYSASGHPLWLNFNASSLTFNGTPEARDFTLAPAVIEVTASDEAGESASLRFSLRVIAGG